MIHCLHILAQGYREWTPGQWVLAATGVLGALGGFLVVTLGPWILKISKEIREVRQQAAESKTQAVIAETKADAANVSIKNTNDRAYHGALVTPVVPADKPATEETLKKVEQDMKPHNSKERKHP